MGRTHTTNAFSRTRDFVDRSFVDALAKLENTLKAPTRAVVQRNRLIERSRVDDKVMTYLRNMGGVAVVDDLIYELEMDKDFVHKSLARLNRGNWIFLDTVDGVFVAATPDNANLKDHIYLEEK